MSKQSQALTDTDLGNGFYGAERDTDMELTPEEIAIRDGVEPVVETVVETVAETVADQVAEPAAATVDETVNDEVVDPVIEPVVAPVVESKVDKKDHMIPISRLNDEITKRRNLERQLEQYQNPLAPAVQAADIPPLDVKIDQEEFSKMSDALLDGKSDIALPIFSKMIADAVKVGVAHGKADTLATVQQDIDKRISRGVDSTLVADQYEAAVDKTYESYPIFNPESPDFDADMMADAKALQSSYQKTHGMVKGHQMAVERALKLHHPELLTAAAPAAAAPAAPAAPARSPEQVRKNAAAAAAQPARPNGKAAAAPDVAPLTIDDLSEEEFDALPESKRAAMRGD